MSRDIKFRAWNKRHHVMVYDVHKGEGFSILLEMEDQEVMQYTGLRDKNDKEIYEGDIIQFVWEEDSCWGKAGTYKGHIGFNQGAFEVIYIGREDITTFEDGSWHENSKSDDMQSFISWSEEIEVIGNIYENSELLEEYHE